eukprot:37114-Pyramimonas_sp.AAC.1
MNGGSAEHISQPTSPPQSYPDGEKCWAAPGQVPWVMVAQPSLVESTGGTGRSIHSTCPRRSCASGPHECACIPGKGTSWHGRAEEWELGGWG